MAAAKWKSAVTKVKMVNSAVSNFKSVPHGIDGATFFSPTIPAEVKEAVPLLYSIDDKAFEILVQASIESFHTNAGVVSDSDFERMQGALGEGQDPKYNAIYTALHSIIRTAVRNRTKASVVEKDLREINVPPHFVDAIVRRMKLERFQLETQSIWRVDVAISSSSLLRVFRPSILFQMALSDGTIRTFEVSVEQFHQLRYNTAKVLRDMQELERHPIMRIAFDRLLPPPAHYRSDKKKFDDPK